MKKSGDVRLKQAIYESPKRKPTPPRCARQPLSREGARVDTPSFLWKEVPRRGGGWGEKRDEKERGRSSQVRRLREHPIHRYAVPLPQWGRQRGGASPPQKEANPASLRSAAPSKGRGSRGHSLLPMEGGAPKGRRLDGGSGMKKIGGDRLKCVAYESTLSTATRSPFPMGKATIREHRYPHIVRANTCMCGKTIPPAKPSPQGEGGERRFF